MSVVSVITMILVISTLTACSEPATNKPSPFPGLSDEQYSRCIDMGSQVVDSMNKYGLDSSQHKLSYSYWNDQCSLTALYDIAQNEGTSSFPISPLDWANRK